MSDALVVTIGQAAELLGITRAGAYRMVHDGTFPVRTVKVGGRIMVSRKRLEEYVDGPDATQVAS